MNIKSFTYFLSTLQHIAIGDYLTRKCLFIFFQIGQFTNNFPQRVGAALARAGLAGFPVGKLGSCPGPRAWT